MVKVRGLGRTVRVRASVYAIEYAYGSSHNDRSSRMCVSLCVCVSRFSAFIEQRGSLRKT